jgi:hypothetical protein
MGSKKLIRDVRDRGVREALYRDGEDIRVMEADVGCRER